MRPLAHHAYDPDIDNLYRGGECHSIDDSGVTGPTTGNHESRVRGRRLVAHPLLTLAT